MREASANTGSLLSVIGVRVRIANSRLIEDAEVSKVDKPVRRDRAYILRACRPAQDSSDFESLFDTVDQRLRFERLSEQACCAVCCRLIIDA